jgi:hypothetical protein
LAETELGPCAQHALGLTGRRMHNARTAWRTRPRRAQSACRGMARSGSSATKPRQGVHHKLPQPTVHSPDTIESPSSQRGRRATEGQNSPAWSTTSELNDGEGVGPSGWGAALGSGEALGSAHGERGGVRRLGTDRAVENKGGATVMAYRRGAAVGAWTKCMGKILFYSHALRGGNAGLHRGREGGDGSARLQS